MNHLFSWLPETANVAIWAMVVASFLPLLFAATAKFIGGFGIADNTHPREFLNNMTGVAARAHAAQQNSYETLPVFLAAVLVAMLYFVPQIVVNTLAWLYVLIRLAYGIAYIGNLPTLRSILWGLSMVCCVLLFYLAIKLSL